MAVAEHTLAVVIPCYRAAETIAPLIGRIPTFVDWIILVNDKSPDNLDQVVSGLSDPRIVYLRHEVNQGVGGAMVTGFRKALELGAQLIAKVDADGQMDPQYLDRFAAIAVRYRCDYVKANRFGHVEALQSMPKIRLWGNLLLTMLTKIASGYWNVFDPQNGYVLVTRTMLRRLNLDKIDRTYFFENSMLINLNILRARIGEINLPAHYGQEPSSMNIRRILLSFPPRLLRGLCWRLYQKYVFRSVSPVAILLVFGSLALVWGCLWGGVAWHRSIATGIPATTGTVILALLPLLLGWSSILQAVVLDVQDAGPCLLFDHDDESLLPDRDTAIADDPMSIAR